MDPGSFVASIDERRGARGKLLAPIVVILCDSLPPYRAAVHRRIIAEVPELTLITAVTHQPEDGRWPAASSTGIPLVNFGPGESTSQIGAAAFLCHEFRKGARITAWLSRIRPSAVIVHGYNDPARVRVLMWCYMQRVPAFVSGDSNIRLDVVTGIRKHLKRILVSAIVRLAHGAFSFGSLGAAYFRRYGAHRVFFMPMEPDYGLIGSISEQEVTTARNRFGFATDRRRMLFSGRFIQQKRVDLLLDAFGAIADARPNWDLVLLGSGPLEQQLKQRVGRSIASRIIWVNSMRDPRDVFAVYRCCDILVLASQYDAWALVLNEAAASGLAIISSDVVGASAELVRDGVNGRLFRRNDLGALRNALLDVTDPANLHRMQSASVEVLNEWRDRGNPVQGFKMAMRSCGVLQANR